MKIQTAIDRVSLERLLEIGESIYGHTDIVEVGTSLIKDYGTPASVRKAYEAGADYATVMGFSSDATIKACLQVAQEFGKECFIDILEVSDERLAHLTEQFPEAVFGIHLPSDMQGEGLTELVRDKCRLLKNVHAVAAAGGVKIGNLPFLKEAGIDIAIVGGAITKAENIGAAAQEFKDAAGN